MTASQLIRFALASAVLVSIATGVRAQNKPKGGKPGEKELFVPKSAQPLEVKLKSTSINDFIKMDVPESFTAMNDDQLAARYPSGRKPMIMFASQDLTVNLGVNGTNNAWENQDLKILADFQKANIRALYENVQFTREELIKQGKKDFAVFEFIADNAASSKTIAKQRQYYYMMYCIVRKQVFIFNFNCPDAQKMQWREHADKIMKSVRVTR